jgi:type I restriction enzyme, S subunit
MSKFILPKGWVNKRLGDIAIISAGQGAPQSEKDYGDEGYPFVKAGNLDYLCNGGELKSIAKVNEKVAKDKKLRLFEAGTIIFAKSGMSCMKERVYCITEPAYIVNHLACIMPLKIYNKYLMYFLKKNPPTKLIKDLSYPSIRLTDISEMEIMLPPLEIQKKIVEVLEKAEKALEKRKEANRLLDELVKSRFIEMFGDPVIDSMKWNCLTVSDVCSKIYGGGTPSKSRPEYFTGSIPWVSPKDMKTEIINDSIDHITEEAVNNSSAKMIPANSVLMVIRSGILKHTLPVAVNSVPVTVNQDMKAFIPKDIVTTKFLAILFKMLEREILGGVRGVTADNIDFNEFKNKLLPIPPKDLQNKFTDFVHQVDKLKFKMQKSLEELENNYQSLMKDAFNGSLKLN